jgi:cell division protein FtsQ
VVKVDERIAERRRQVRDERRRSRLRRTVTVAVLLALLGLAVAVERSSLVALAEIRVEGTARLRPDTLVVDAADLPLGTSTLRLRLGAAEQRVEALPLVAEATVRRLDPLTVLVSVQERQPVAVVTGGEAAALVDDDGIVIATGSESGLVVIDLGAIRPPTPGAHVTAVPPLANAHAAMQLLPGPLRTEIVRYDAVAGDDVQIVLADGTRVRLGRAERIDEKARALGAVLEDLDGRAVDEIDVRAPSRPVVALKPGLKQEGATPVRPDNGTEERARGLTALDHRSSVRRNRTGRQHRPQL